MTTIEWTEESWNPFRARNKKTGGVGHFCVAVSPGCKNCYAEGFQPRLKNPIRYAAQDLALVEPFVDYEVLAKPFSWRRGRMIFPCSMTDLFADFHCDDWIDFVVAVAALTPEHTYQVLTKRAGRMREYWATPNLANRIAVKVERLAIARNQSQYYAVVDRLIRGEGWPLPNWWQGVSVEDQERANERLPMLAATPSVVRWASFEPLLGEVDVFPYLNARSLDWGVIGGESGRSARTTTIGHLRSLKNQFDAAGVPVFMKQAGAKPVNRELVAHPISTAKGGALEDLPEDLRVREFPR